MCPTKPFKHAFLSTFQRINGLRSDSGADKHANASASSSKSQKHSKHNQKASTHSSLASSSKASRSTSNSSVYNNNNSTSKNNNEHSERSADSRHSGHGSKATALKRSSPVSTHAARTFQYESFHVFDWDEYLEVGMTLV